MDTDKHGLKAGLRRQIRAALERISPVARAVASDAACQRLKIQMQSAGMVLFFAPLPSEVNVWPLLEQALAAGRTAALPRFDSTCRSYTACRVENLAAEIVSGQFGIREPGAACPEISLERLDLILVPGVAFDLAGRRLGRGKGYYDRLLAKAAGLKCGVAFDEQIVDAVPAAAHDVKMDFILTPTRCVNCSK
jgi:5-formyltetrahydrofolate cyclo-ligase